ncbi:MAG: hypothetical protein D6778_06765, partial [Nitrospirae bacterium]
HVIAFAREYEGQWAVVVVGRFFSLLCRPGTIPTGKRFWKDTSIILPENLPLILKDQLTGQTFHLRKKTLSLYEVFKILPQSILVGKMVNQ